MQTRRRLFSNLPFLSQPVVLPPPTRQFSLFIRAGAMLAQATVQLILNNPVAALWAGGSAAWANSSGLIPYWISARIYSRKAGGSGAVFQACYSPFTQAYHWLSNRINSSLVVVGFSVHLLIWVGSARGIHSFREFPLFDQSAITSFVGASRSGARCLGLVRKIEAKRISLLASRGTMPPGCAIHQNNCRTFVRIVKGAKTPHYH